MKHRRRSSHRLIRTAALTAACAAVVLALAASAIASNGPNYGNFNPLTGKPNSVGQTGIEYGGFNPLTGRPDSAALPADRGAQDVSVRATPQPAPTAVQTVIRDQGSQALPIALAGAALLIALAGAGYAVIRVSRLPRPERTR